jgi:hypothetical protein
VSQGQDTPAEHIPVPAEPPAADDGAEVFRFRLYAATGGEIGTLTSAISSWAPGEVVTIGDGRRFEIRRVTVVAGGEIDGLFDVDQVE